MCAEDADFAFLDPGRLVDDDLELVLVETRPGDASRGRVPEYRFEMRVTGKSTGIGDLCFRVGLTDKLKRYGGNIGYGVQEEYRGHKYAARSCKLLFPLARRHGINTLWITCSPDNLASRRTCEVIDAKLVDTIEAEVEPGKYRPTCRYRVSLGIGNSGRPSAGAAPE